MAGAKHSLSLMTGRGSLVCLPLRHDLSEVRGPPTKAAGKRLATSKAPQPLQASCQSSLDNSIDFHGVWNVLSLDCTACKGAFCS